MCDPLTIAGIALTAGSTVMNTMAQNKVAKARSSAMEAERLRQRGFDAEAQALNKVSQDRYQDFGEQQEKRGEELGDYLAQQDISKDLPEGGYAGEIMPASSSAISVQGEQQAQGKARAYTQKQGKNLGTLRAFGDYLGDVSRKQASDASLIGQIGGFKRGSSEIVPFELEAANQQGNSLKMFGDMMNLAGGMAMNYGLGGNLQPLDMSGAGPWGASLPAVTRSSVPVPRLRRTLTTADLGLGGLYGGPR